MGLIADLMERQRQREQAERAAKFTSEVEAAGSRERALEIVKNYSAQFQDTKDFTTAFQVVNQFYPEPSKEIKQVTVFHRETGEATPRFVPSGEMSALEDPAEVERRFGPGATLTKPDIETFYRAPGPENEWGTNIQIVGRRPIAQRPEGAVTLPELTEARLSRAEAKREASDRTRGVMNDFTRLTAISLNAKMLPDGTWTFDDDNRAKLFNERLRFAEELIRMEPGIIKSGTGGVRLHNRASKALPLTSETKPPEPVKPSKKEEPGLLSKGVEFVKGALSGEQRSKPAEGRVTTPAQQISARAAEIKARRDLTAEQRDAALKRLREIAAKNKVKVEF